MINAVFLTGPSDLLMFRCGLAMLDLPQTNWVVALTGTAKNIAPDMLSCCRKVFPNAELISVQIDQADALGDFIRRYGIKFDLFATSHLFGRFEEYLLSTVKWNALILTENGIATYFPPRGRLGILFGDPALRPTNFPDYAILPLLAHRSLRLPTYLSGNTTLKLAPEQPDVRDKIYADLRKQCCVAWVEKIYAAKQDLAVVSGTSLARLRVVTAEQERHAYQKALEDFVDKGTSVLWKPHPRAAAGGLLPPEIPQQVTIIQGSLPLEIYLPGAVGAGNFCSERSLVSLASSTLLTSALHHGMMPELLDAELKTDGFPHINIIRQISSDYVRSHAASL